MTVRIVRAAERTTQQVAQTPGMTREQAFADDRYWAGIARTAPGTVSGWHHHGEHDSFIYVVSGAAKIEFGKGGRESHDARTGDFVFVPKHVVHRESNPGSQESTIALVRVGSGPPVVNVEGPEV